MRNLSWHDALAEIKTGDVLLCRSCNLGGKAIENLTKGAYSHAAMAGWSYPQCPGLPMLMMSETLQTKAARVISLEAEVRRWPGLYDVYRVKGPFNPIAAWEFMQKASGSCYGWLFILCTWARRRLGKWIPALRNSDDPETNRDCSALVHAALRAGGGPQVSKFDVDVAPGDLAQCDYALRYVGTLWDVCPKEE